MLEVGKGIEIVLVSVNRVYVLVAQVYRLSATRGGCDRREQGATFWREEKKLGMEFELAWPLTSSSISHLLSHHLTCTPSPIKVPHSRHLATHHNSLFLRPFFLFQYDPPSQLHTIRALPPCAMSWRHRYPPSHRHHDLYFLPYFLPYFFIRSTAPPCRIPQARMRARFLGQKQAWSFNLSSGLHASTTFPRRPPNEPPDSDTSSPLTAPAAAPSACSQPVACHTCIASSARATGGWRVKAHRAFNGARGASWDWCGSVSILGSHGCLESRSSTSRRLQCLRFLDTARDRPFCSRD